MTQQKAVILVRVSSLEQTDGHSLQAQADRLQEYCTRKGLEKDKLFEIVESSTQGARKKFFAMLNYIKTLEGPVAIVVDAVDRMQRSFKESLVLEDLRASGTIEMHFVREGLVLKQNSSPMELIQWDYHVIGAKSYVLNLSQNVKRSIEYKLKSGQWIGPAPLGYLNAKDEITDKNIVVLDPLRSHLIRRIFDLYSTGSYSVRAVAKIIREEGLTNRKSGKPISANQVDNILQDPFYYGVMEVKGQQYPHYYPRIIDEMLFFRCKEVRDSWHKKPFKFAAKPFVLRGLVQCAYCGCVITFDKKKDKYTYGKCTGRRGKCDAVRVSEDTMLDQVAEMFKNIRIPENILVDIKEKLAKTQESKQVYQKDILESLRKEYDHVQRKLDNLLDLRLSESITQNDYDKKARELKNRQHEIDIMQRQHTKADENFGITVSYLLDLASRAYDLFQSSNVDQKRLLINFVGSNLRLKGKKVLWDYKKPFEAFAVCSKSENWLPRLGSNQ